MKSRITAFFLGLLLSVGAFAGLETATYISDLVVTNPVGATDPKSQGDDHVRLIKSTIKNSFPNITGPMTSSQAELNILDGALLSTAELNILDGVTSSAAELNIVDGVTATAADLNKTINITSGTYVPTLTIVSNLSGGSITNLLHRYIRVGNFVTVYGKVTIPNITNPATTTSFTVSLPIASASPGVIGTAVFQLTTTSNRVVAEVLSSGTSALVETNPGGNTSLPSNVSYTFQYTI